MRLTCVRALCSLVGLIFLSVSVDAREWKDSTGAFRVEAELVEVRDDVVVLKRADNGNVLSVPRNRLSPTDQQYLDSLSESPQPPASEPVHASKSDMTVEPEMVLEPISAAGETGTEPNDPGAPTDAPSNDIPPANELTSPLPSSTGDASENQPSITDTSSADEQGEEVALIPQPVVATETKSMWDQVRSLIVGSSPLSLALQYAFLLVVTFGHIYQILRMRRATVVVLSHARIVVNVFVITALNVALYQVALWLMPTGSKVMFVLYLIGFVFAIGFWRVIIQGVGGAIDQDRTVKDTTAGKEKLFNCNWPLIPRCCLQSLNYLALFGLFTKGAL